MRRDRLRVRVGLLAALIVPALARPAPAQERYQYPSKVEISWNRLYTGEEVVGLCRKLVEAYPEMLTMERIGSSFQGRDLWALTLNVPATGPPESKPAMYIDANIHGNEVQGTEVVLYTIWYLTKSYGRVPRLTELMDRCAFYFVPMANPDGRAYWFEKPNTMHSSRGGQKPTDNDGDGLFDEDPPNDLDGDGLILEMRREDPDGRWRESPDDPRLMVPVDPESKGRFKRYQRLGSEGIDDDGDGRINEDGPGGYDPNRNWPVDWQPEYIQHGAGDFPLSLPESRAIAEFILARPNIAAVQAYHNFGGMILRGPGHKAISYPAEDLAVYDRIGRRGEQILPFYKYLVVWRDLYTVHGGFVTWTAEDLGIISFTNELWTSRKYFGREDRPGQQERLDFDDYLLFGQSFVPWKEYEHPLYGRIELGGWTKLAGRVPPAFHLEEMCHRNFAFTMFHAEQMPLIELRNLEIRSLGQNLWRVRVDVHNRRLIPTTTRQAALRRYGPRDCIMIDGDNLRVLAGGTLADRFLAPFEFVTHRPERLWIDDGIPGEGSRTFQWIVAGTGRVTIRTSMPRARDVELTCELAEQPARPTP